VNSANDHKNQQSRLKPPKPIRQSHCRLCDDYDESGNDNGPWEIAPANNGIPACRPSSPSFQSNGCPLCPKDDDEDNVHQQPQHHQYSQHSQNHQYPQHHQYQHQHHQHIHHQHQQHQHHHQQYQQHPQHHQYQQSPQQELRAEKIRRESPRFRMQSSAQGPVAVEPQPQYSPPTSNYETYNPRKSPVEKLYQSFKNMLPQYKIPVPDEAPPSRSHMQKHRQDSSMSPQRYKIPLPDSIPVAKGSNCPYPSTKDLQNKLDNYGFQNTSAQQPRYKLRVEGLPETFYGAPGTPVNQKEIAKQSRMELIRARYGSLSEEPAVSLLEPTREPSSEYFHPSPEKDRSVFLAEATSPEIAPEKATSPRRMSPNSQRKSTSPRRRSPNSQRRARSPRRKSSNSERSQSKGRSQSPSQTTIRSSEIVSMWV